MSSTRAPTIVEKDGAAAGPHAEPKSELDGVALADAEANPAAPPAGAGFTVPDGGWEAWSVVVGGWFALFATFGYVSGPLRRGLRVRCAPADVRRVQRSACTRSTTSMSSACPTAPWPGSARSSSGSSMPWGLASAASSTKAMDVSSSSAAQSSTRCRRWFHVAYLGHR
jgi:hypothetical protein